MSSAAKVHLVGIGGVGMSALAEAFIDAGYAVSGSDRFLDSAVELPVFAKLRAQGIRIFPQDGSGIDTETSFIVTSTAIESDNPDRKKAIELGIEVVHRATALANLLSAKTLVAVAGTSGKSTTTAILGHILACAGLDPTVINGAACLNFASTTRTGAVRKGSGKLCVAEVDESDKSLLSFAPHASLILNSSADHFSLTETNELFDAFAARTTGPVIDLRGATIPEVEEAEWGVKFRMDDIPLYLPLPGAHNAADALAAARMARALGVAEDAIASALLSFKGVGRRLELVGMRSSSIKVVDDYSHNTEKIRAAIRTLKPRARNLVAVWRPHGYTPLRNMLAAMRDMFLEELSTGDTLILPPVFYAGGTTTKNIDSDDLAHALIDSGATERGIGVICVADMREAQSAAARVAKSGDAIAIMGARDPEISKIAKNLAEGL